LHSATVLSPITYLSVISISYVSLHHLGPRIAKCNTNHPDWRGQGFSKEIRKLKNPAQQHFIAVTGIIFYNYFVMRLPQKGL
jgi:hypothetical protein